jgi:hypothetical protein
MEGESAGLRHSGRGDLVKSKIDGCAFLWLSSSGAIGLRCQLLTTSLWKNWKYYRNDLLATYSLSAFVSAIIILCMSFPSADTYAQQAAPAAQPPSVSPSPFFVLAWSPATPLGFLRAPKKEPPRIAKHIN